MKKIFSLAAGLVMAAFATTTTNAQSYISIGPVGSIGHSWLSNMDGDASFKLAPALGIGLVYSRNEHWGFGGELMVSHEGYSQDYMYRGNEYNEKVNPVYLRLPLHATYFFGSYKSSVRPKVYLGPTLGVKVDEKYSVSNNFDEGNTTVTGDADVFKTFDFGLNAGVGVNFKVGRKTWLNTDLGYYHGLLNVVENSGSESYRNRNLRLNVGVMIGI